MLGLFVLSPWHSFGSWQELRRMKDLVPTTHSGLVFALHLDCPKKIKPKYHHPPPTPVWWQTWQNHHFEDLKIILLWDILFPSWIASCHTKELCFEFHTLQVRERWRMTILIYILRWGKIWSNHLMIQKLPWCNPSEKRGRSSINQLRSVKWREMCQTILKFMLVSEYHRMCPLKLHSCIA